MIGASEVTMAMLYSTSSLQRATFAWSPATHFSRKTFDDIGEQAAATRA